MTTEINRINSKACIKINEEFNTIITKIEDTNKKTVTIITHEVREENITLLKALFFIYSLKDVEKAILTIFMSSKVQDINLVIEECYKNRTHTITDYKQEILTELLG